MNLSSIIVTTLATKIVVDSYITISFIVIYSGKECSKQINQLRNQCANPMRIHFYCSIIIACTAIYVLYGYYTTERGITVLDIESFSQNRHPLTRKSFIPWPFWDNHSFLHDNGWDEELARLSVEYDSRVVPALWLAFFMSDFGADVSLPFSWATYLGLPSKLDNWNDLVALNYRNLKPVHVPEGFPNLNISGPLDKPFPEASRRSIGASYLIYTAPYPRTVTFLGVGPLQGEERLPLIFPILDLERGSQRRDIQLLVQMYWAQYAESTIDLQLMADTLRQRWESMADCTKRNHPYVFSANVSTQTDTSAFEVAGPILDNGFKYFHEALLETGPHGFHFDWRFFQRERYSQYEHQEIMHRLSKAWLRYSRQMGIVSWLAHGSLLGWSWNGLNMPWDDDLDVQVSFQSLVSLARYNQTLVVDLTDDTTFSGGHLYFLDVNPHFTNRSHGDGENAIDARFIDVDSGMYVDITALSIGQDFNAAEKTDAFHQIVDSEYLHTMASVGEIQASEFEKYQEDLREKETALWYNKLLMNCKDNHYYNIEELIPLQGTYFEGERAFVPHEWKKILNREFKHGLRDQEYGEWTFRPYLGIWVPRKICKGDYHGKRCKHAETIAELKLTQPMRHRKGKFDKAYRNQSRADPWLMRRNKRLWKLELDKTELSSGTGSY